VLSYHIFDQGEPQTVTANTFRGKEGLEYFVQVLRRNPAAVIGKRYP
jgi:hypothetical protein